MADAVDHQLDGDRAEQQAEHPCQEGDGRGRRSPPGRRAAEGLGFQYKACGVTGGADAIFTCRAFGPELVATSAISGLRREPMRAIRDPLPLTFGTVLAADGDVLWRSRFPDGEEVEVGVCGDGAHVVAYGEHARFRIARGGSAICADVAHDGPAWERFLLDTVLWWAALMRGATVLHASVVELGGAAVAITAPSGGGKTTLAAALLDLGGSLVADDVLVLPPTASGEIVAASGPAVMNLPAAMDDPTKHGEELARFREDGDEVWRAVRGCSRAAVHLAGIVMLDRDAAGTSRMEREEGLPLALLAAQWVLPGASSEESHFAAMADLAGAVPLYALRAGPTAAPDELAGVLEHAMRQVST